MTFTGNTVPFKTEWIKAYQETHYKQPVFPVFADQRFASQLVEGGSIKWSYDSDADVQQLGADGSYQSSNKVITDEILNVDQKPYSTFRIPTTQKIQDHRPTQQKWAVKAMNRIFWSIDAKVLGAMQAAATSSVTAGDFGGTSGAPITLSTALAAPIFTAARRVLRNNSVIYSANKKYSNIVKLDTVDKYPACAIPAELEEALLLAIGFKPGDLGDTVIREGYLNFLFGFNTFVSTALPFTINYVVAAANATNGDTFTIGGNTFQVVTSNTVAGDIKIGVNAAATAANIAAALSAPYTASSTYTPLVRSTSTPTAQAAAFVTDMMSAAQVGATATVTITVLGHGTLPYSQTVAANGLDSTTAAVHAIFAVSQSIALVIQRYPVLEVSAGGIIGNGATGGFLAQDFVTYTLAGWKVFKTHIPQIVDVPILASTYKQPLAILN